MGTHCTNVPWLPTALLSLVLAGCGDGGSSGGTGGSLNLGVTDAPVDGVTKVVIEFSEVQVHSSTGDTLDFVLPAPQQIDLLALAGGKHALLLDHQALAAGQYEWIRLFVNEADSYVMTDTGAQHALHIPSNAQTGLKLNRPFTLAANGVASFIVDFNLHQSLHLPQGNGQPYLLRPTLRIVDAVTTGSINGTVDANLVTAPGCADAVASNGTVGGSVYVYSGSDMTPVDINTNRSAGQPASNASVTLNNGTWEYTAAYLEPGAYTVAFTCQSSLDEPDTTDNITFQNPANVTVGGAQTTTHNFP